MNRTHGLTGSPIYTRWASMKQRCLDKKHHKYPYYGGRGIKVCDRWMGFDAFREDMELSFEAHVKEHGLRQTLLEREDNGGDYSRENCRWATNTEQANNRRSNILVTRNGKTQNLKQWGDELGINYHTLYGRVNAYGWSIDKAFAAGKYAGRGKNWRTA